MEKPQDRILLPCPVNNETCKYYPNCRESIHHTFPRRLAGLAFEAGASEDYRAKLKKVIKHPSTHIFCCRNIHDLLDATTSDELPSERRLDSTIARFDE